MKKNYLLILSDSLFTGFLTFLFCFFITNYFIKNAASIIVSATAAIILTIFTFAALKSKRGKKDLKRKEKEDCERVVLQLCFMPKTELIAFIEKLFKEENLVFSKYGGGFLFTENKAFVYLAFNADGCTKTDVVKAFNKLNSKSEKAYIFCSFCNKETLDFSNRFDNKTIIVCGKKLYPLMKKHNLFPPEKYNFAFIKRKYSFRKILKRKKAKNYAFFGLTFGFFAFLVSFKIYYVITACAFLLLAAIALLFGNDEKDNDSSITT